MVKRIRKINHRPNAIALQSLSTPLATEERSLILVSAKKFVSTLTTDVLADVLRKVRKVGANFARPFSLSNHYRQRTEILEIEPGLA
jgi:hypothetical protein